MVNDLVEKNNKELGYLDIAIEKYQSKIEEIPGNSIYKQELKRNLASLELKRYRLIQENEKINKENTLESERVLREIKNYKDEFNDNLFDEIKLHNFKIVYEKGRYILEFDILENNNIIHHTYEKNKLIKSYESKKYKDELAKKYNIDRNSKFYKYMDINLLLALEKIDSKYGTTYVEDYKNGTLDCSVKYDLKGILSSENLEIGERIPQRKVALNQIRLINGVTIKNKNSLGFLIGTLTTTVVLCSLCKISLSGKNDNSREKTNNQGIIREIEEDLVEEEKKSFENEGLKIGDSLKLINKDDNGNIKSTYMLSKNLNDNNSDFLASEYNYCDKFIVSSIVVRKDDKVIKEINRFSNQTDICTNQLYDKYGKDIDIFLGFDAHIKSEKTMICYNIGWLNLTDFELQNPDVYIEDIEQEKEKQQKEKETEDRINAIIENMTKYHDNNQDESKVYVKK